MVPGIVRSDNRAVMARGATGACLAAWLLVGCQASEVPVALEMQVQRDGNTLHVDVSTDLPDGALLSWELRHEHYGHDVETPIDMLFASGILTVQDGAADATLDLSLFDAGAIDLEVAFAATLERGMEQPADIRSRFGRGNRNVVGDNVTLGADGSRRVAVVHSVSR